MRACAWVCVCACVRKRKRAGRCVVACLQHKEDRKNSSRSERPPSSIASYFTFSAGRLSTWPIMFIRRAASSLAAFDRTRLLNMVSLRGGCTTAINKVN